MAAAHTVTQDPRLSKAGNELLAQAALSVREQRRYEISKAAPLHLFVCDSGTFWNMEANRPCKTFEENVTWGVRASVAWADALLAELEK